MNYLYRDNFDSVAGTLPTESRAVCIFLREGVLRVIIDNAFIAFPRFTSYLVISFFFIVGWRVEGDSH